MGAPPPDPLGGDHRIGPWQRTGVVSEGGLAHPDDTCGKALQPRWRTGSPWLLDRCDEEAGRSNPHRPLTSNDLYPRYCMAINSNIVSHFFHFHPDDNWSIQSKRQQSYLPNSMQQPTEKPLKDICGVDYYMDQAFSLNFAYCK